MRTNKCSKLPGLLPLLAVLLFICSGMKSYATMQISSLSGPVTTNEINSFITYMATQTPPTTPWAVGDAWADGYGGTDLESFGMMYEASGNVAILNTMIAWTDDCVAQRNDLMSATN